MCMQVAPRPRNGQAPPAPAAPLHPLVALTPSGIGTWCSGAFHTVSLILLNTSIGVAFAWLVALCFSLGNLFSGQRAAQQSRRSFLIGTILWDYAWFCLCICLFRSFSLFHLELLSHPGRKAGGRRILGRMFRHTALPFTVGAALSGLIGYGCGSLDSSWSKYKFVMYGSALPCFTFVSVVDQAARRIYRRETTQGLLRQQRHKETATAGSPHTRGATRATTQSPALQRPSGGGNGSGSRSRRPIQYGRNGWVILSAFVPTLYVHFICLVSDTLLSTWHLWLFTGASIALKVAMQETAKWFILKQNLHNPRAMVVLVAVPTVVIDTQVRLVFLRLQSAKATVATTMGLAATEISVRLFKSLWTRRQIKQRCHNRERQQQQQQSIGHLGSSTREATSPPPPQSDGHQATETAAFELWKSQLHQYHTTELVADMYAEYLAIGCSSVILFVLGDHPQFAFRPDPAAGVVHAAVTSPSIYWQLLVQVAVEVLVDFLCCCGEIAGGLSFRSTTQERAFYLVFFITLAVVNITLSAMFYVT